MNEKYRVIYKQTGKPPVVKIIKDTTRLKKLVVADVLKMIRYEKHIILCYKSQQNQNIIPNIVLTFGNIAGDFIFIGYNVKAKDFRSLTIDEIEFYLPKLSRKSFNIYSYKRFWDKKLSRINKINGVNFTKEKVKGNDEKDRQEESQSTKNCQNIKDNNSNKDDNSNLITLKKIDNVQNSYDTDVTRECMKLILRIQNDILKFINDYTNISEN